MGGGRQQVGVGVMAGSASDALDAWRCVVFWLDIDPFLNAKSSRICSHNTIALQMSQQIAPATDGQYVVATLYDEVCISHENLAEAQVIPVNHPTTLHKVLVPSHLKQILMVARASKHQLRFNLAFDNSTASRFPIIAAASPVPFASYAAHHPVPTAVYCGFCVEQPFDFKTRQWLPSVPPPPLTLQPFFCFKCSQ